MTRIAEWIEDGLIYVVVVVASIPTYLWTMRRRYPARHEDDEMSS
ncbi:hypothetical protein [Gemmatirosa kalamazoonensis]|nr:hypothetical protein [Gemmatirosa kalamazoonensis]